MNKNFFYLMVILPIVSIIFISSTILYIDGEKYDKISSYYNQHILDDFVNDNKKVIKDRVEFVNDIIEFDIRQLESLLKFELEGMLTLTYQLVDDIYKKNTGKISNEKIIEKIIETLSTLKYNDNKGYFYITDYSNEIMLWHPLKTLRGISLSNSIDIKGNLRIKVVKDSLENGDKYGFSKIYLAKPNTKGDKKEYQRMTGVFHYKPLDILVGTGEFLDEIKNRLKKQVMQRVNLLNRDQKIGTIRLIEYNQEIQSYDCILGTKPCEYLVKNTSYPKNLNDITTDINTEYKGFIKFKDDEITRYIYYLYHKDWDWIIQSEFYEDDMMYSLNNIQNLIKDDEKKIFKNSLFVIVLFVVLTLVVSFIILNKIKNVMFSYTQEIKEQKDELEIIFATTKDGIAILDLETNFLYFNESYSKILGLKKEKLLCLKCLNITAKEDMEKVKNAIEVTKTKGYFENLEKTYIVNDKRVSVNMSLALLPDKQRMLISIKDITDSKRRQKQIKNYISLIDKYIITSSTDINGNITQVSEAFAKISGYDKKEIIGKNHNIVRHPDMPKSLFDDLWATILKDKVWHGEIKNKKSDGSYYWVEASISPNYDETGKKIGYTAIRQDITDKKRIEEISITDGLTKVYNRRHFDEIVPKIINSAKRENELISFIILDIDHFKQYNDTYGHQAGDDVLTQVANMLDKCMNRADDYCFRLGGEEFGLIFKAKSKDKAIQYSNIIKNSIESMKIVHEKNSASKYITVSMGLICEFASNIKDKEILYKEGDDLLYRAKETGRNKVCYKEG